MWLALRRARRRGVRKSFKEEEAMCEQGPGWVGDGGLLHDFDAFEETDNFEHPEDLNHA